MYYNMERGVNRFKISVSGHYLTRTFLIIVIWTTLPFATLKSQNTRLDSYFSTKAKQGELNGIVFVAEKDKVLYHKAFGFADFENKKANTIEIHFPIASVTKLFTTTAALQLVERGLLKLDIPVKFYLPEFLYPNVTLAHLLSHTSGLPSWDTVFEKAVVNNPDAIFTNESLVSEYSKQNIPLLFNPGTRHEYVNANTAFVALLVEKVSGEAYKAYIEQHIFAPAGMKDTFIPSIPFYNNITEEKRSRAKLYTVHMYSFVKENEDNVKSTQDYWSRFRFNGFGEFVTTTEDLFRFYKALVRGKLIKLSTLQMAQTPMQLNDGTTIPRGLGWQVETNKVLGKIVGHGGGVKGLSTSFIYQPVKQRLAIVFDNTQQNAEDMTEDALMILAGEKPTLLKNNLARIYGHTLLKKGTKPAREMLYKLKNDTVNYSVSEQQFNKLGYDFLNSGKMAQALETFHINTELFPQSYNTFDSYGEALLKLDQKDKALMMYKKSVELNPDNENGKKMIKMLLNR